MIQKVLVLLAEKSLETHYLYNEKLVYYPDQTQSQRMNLNTLKFLLFSKWVDQYICIISLELTLLPWDYSFGLYTLRSLSTEWSNNYSIFILFSHCIQEHLESTGITVCIQNKVYKARV